MNIKILQGEAGAKEATGLAIVIDVLRAFSNTCYMASRNPKTILPVLTIEEAFELREKIPNSVIVGERKGILVEGFDYGNRPSCTSVADLEGKTIIHTTTNGTRGLVQVENAQRVITGSLCNSAAIAKFIQDNNFEEVSLVAMGRYDVPMLEDTICAEYIESILRGQPLDHEFIRKEVRACEQAKSYYDETQDGFPLEDLDLCLEIDRFPFVLEVKKDNNQRLYLEKIPI